MKSLDRVETIIIHHTGSDNHTVESIRDLHVNQRSWEDIGYHYIIGNGDHTDNGHVYRGRDAKWQGAHVKGHNEGSIGVALIGNYDEKQPTEPQLYALTTLLETLLNKHNLGVSDIIGHRDISGVTKTCPGDAFDLDTVRERLY